MTDLVELITDALDHPISTESQDAIKLLRKAAAEITRLHAALVTLTRERDEAAAREAVMRDAACKCWPTSSHHEPGCPVLDDDFSPRAEALLRVVGAAIEYVHDTRDATFDALEDHVRAYQEGSK